MDRTLEKRLWTRGRVAGLVLVLGLGLLAAWSVLDGRRGARLEVDPDRLRMGEVTQGPFQEYILPMGEIIHLPDAPGDGLGVQAAVDRGYQAAIAAGQAATLEILGRTFRLRVNQVHPVEGARFAVDLRFDGEGPGSEALGQSAPVRLELGGVSQALLLPRGAFFQQTGGRWAFVVDPSGETATRRPVRLGRQNPEFHEVLEGLRPGERVVTSSYAGFEAIDQLVFDR
jgi:HlyD family secretion protein